jgi:tRNA G18 (ribose-2'-O)-methylase SpoU
LLPLKAAGYSIVALERNQNSCSLYQALTSGALKLPLCLLVGNEVQGVSIEALELCDQVCHLNMRGKKESLNASVAFGVAAYFLAESLL